MTDHTPSGLPQPQTVQRALIDALDLYLRQDETAGDTDNGVYRRGAEAMKAALSAPAVETVAVQKALTRLYDMAFEDGSDRPDEAYNEQRKSAAINLATAAILPVAPKAEPSEDAVQAAFEVWLARTCPSGDMTEVQRQWEASSDYADLYAASAPDRWLSIDTAPKDESVLIAASPDWVFEARQDLNDVAGEQVWQWVKPNGAPLPTNLIPLRWRRLPTFPREGA